MSSVGGTSSNSQQTKESCKSNQKWCEHRNMCIESDKFDMECICSLGESACLASEDCVWCSAGVKGYVNKNCAPKGDSFADVCLELETDDNLSKAAALQLRLREIERILSTSPTEDNSDLVDEKDEIYDELKELKVDIVKDSDNDQDGPQNCLNRRLGSEYNKYGCDLYKNYNKCLEEYEKGNCLL